MERYSTQKTMIRNQQECLVISCTDIMYGKAQGSYCTIHMTDGNVYTLSKNLKMFEQSLNLPFMMRINQSVLLNLFYVKHVFMKNKQIELFNGECFPFRIKSRELYSTLDKLLDRNVVA